MRCGRDELLRWITGAVFVTGCLKAAEPPTGLYRAPNGPQAVDVADDILLRDAKQEKDLRLKVYFPREKGPFPVIIFSHGAGGSRNGYEPLARYWCSHGYVSIHPTHADSATLRAPAERVGGLRDAISRTISDPRAWAGRARDISFVIDSLEELERRVPALQGKPDRAAVGVGGHSYGAYTAQLIGGATVDLPGGEKAQSFADPRVRCMLVISGQGTGQQGLTKESWQKVTRPVMTMTGSRDRGAGGQGPEWKRESFDFSPPGDKYHVFIEGASHFSFSGRPTGDPEGVFDCVKSATLAFWDAHLRGDAAARAYLASEALPRAAQSTVKLSRK